MSYFIQESAIYQEANVINKTPGKAIFRCTVQTEGEINQNKRMYTRSVLDEGMQGCEPRMKSRAFLSELDHPFPQGNQVFDQIRQTTVSLKETSHLIRSYEWKKNHLVAEMETLSTPNGSRLLNLLNDKVGVGFSMRGLAELERLQDYNLVKSPLTIIAFDSVSQPSHKAAVVDFNEMTFEETMITEQAGLVCLDGRCFLPDYFDKLVETRSIEFFKRWI